MLQQQQQQASGTRNSPALLLLFLNITVCICLYDFYCRLLRHRRPALEHRDDADQETRLLWLLRKQCTLCFQMKRCMCVSTTTGETFWNLLLGCCYVTLPYLLLSRPETESSESGLLLHTVLCFSLRALQCSSSLPTRHTRAAAAAAVAPTAKDEPTGCSTEAGALEVHLLHHPQRLFSLSAVLLNSAGAVSSRDLQGGSQETDRLPSGRCSSGETDI